MRETAKDPEERSMIPQDIKDTAEKVRSIVVLTGAGISAESGVPTFRGEDGLWNTYRAEELANPAAFARDPSQVWEWYDWRRELIGACRPNPAHTAIADLEKFTTNAEREFLLITQNIDDLHREAGSRKMAELHGNIWRMQCTEEESLIEDHAVPLRTIPPLCRSCGSLLRPDVVWFGESLDPDVVHRAWTAAEGCDLMLVVGTSAVVYPAASLPSVAKSGGAVVIEVNIEPTPVSRIADHSIYGKAGEILPDLIPELKSNLMKTDLQGDPGS